MTLDEPIIAAIDYAYVFRSERFKSMTPAEYAVGIIQHTTDAQIKRCAAEWLSRQPEVKIEEENKD